MKYTFLPQFLVDYRSKYSRSKDNRFHWNKVDIQNLKFRKTKG